MIKALHFVEGFLVNNHLCTEEKALCMIVNDGMQIFFIKIL